MVPSLIVLWAGIDYLDLRRCLALPLHLHNLSSLFSTLMTHHSRLHFDHTVPFLACLSLIDWIAFVVARLSGSSQSATWCSLSWTVYGLSFFSWHILRRQIYNLSLDVRFWKTSCNNLHHLRSSVKTHFVHLSETETCASDGSFLHLSRTLKWDMCNFLISASGRDFFSASAMGLSFWDKTCVIINHHFFRGNFFSSGSACGGHVQVIRIFTV